MHQFDKFGNFNQIIVFTDLDGTLLDHETYSHKDALPALSKLKANNCPLILASSKTAAEIYPLRNALGFSHCKAIVENGAGLLEPGETSQRDYTKYNELLAALDELPTYLTQHFESFHQWNAEKVAQMTGLSLIDATNAKKRQFSEPGLWSGSDDEFLEFAQALSEKDMIVQQGGRFKTLSFGGNKAERVTEISDQMLVDSEKILTVALGDASNDIAMLNVAKLGVIIPNMSHNGIPKLDGETSGRIIRASQTGPRGWNEVMINLIESIYERQD